MKSHKFWNQVTIPDQCWEWQGGKSVPGGYGKTTRNNKSEYAHRVAWELFHNETIPDGLCVLHRCDNPSCVNPFHLFLGTKGENKYMSYMLLATIRTKAYRKFLALANRIFLKFALDKGEKGRYNKLCKQSKS